MFGILVPFINRFVRKLPDTTVSDDKKGIIASLFHAVFPASVRWMVDWVLQVGPVLVVSLPFFLTPGIITSYGAIFVGQVYPCYMSVTTLIQNGAVRSNVKGKKKAKQLAGKPSKKVPMPRGHENDATRPEARHDVHWLTYWCTYSPLRMGLHVLMVYLPSVPGWYHIELGMVIWLMMKGSGVLVNELDLLLFRRNWKKLDNIQRQKGMMEVGEEPAVKLTETEIKDESTTISATKTIVASPAIKREGRHKEPELDAQTTEQTQLPLRSNTDISTDGPPSSSSNVRKRVGKTPSTGKLNL
ncbi:hypothetical protein SARC_03008 [Sphaeroforma arctica JP610]|uniref:Receptor expression-enhancing protein n=1 Tax=Sphaeroforma arctica JP610 TaxID=667725 RepID=A0A0L0G710_9EUKA|nr:hypothetical protein SARC_03008 [Sphaeroforma arctica JP610]KNC84800.1 hypothetical protein SARC_03008 [Sphaeroforma arctica JP610]|eukprot:XP_014158702.1 hypothetical protein SARC_03008 [Sphaeroforma arctica JP610]